ncbi:MAG: L,D-transpeptidase [Devosia sp.]|uniref:L,D-transpeptidase n=1 Tax=Devosia sp. TaxID=1871048 RepID=UPI001AC3C598|nr:L,D-transpeptidase [Devosia sp.]MBN9315723.1 L,D-transpeptidase [Devosia sp.]
MTTRRLFLAGSAAFALSACSSTGRSRLENSNVIQVDEPWASHYSLRHDGGFTIPGIDIRKIPEQFWRQDVDYSGSEAPGTIVVNTTDRFLYLVQPGGRAIRYGVGVGREEGLNFRGTATIARKAEWPRWTPTANMIKTQPERYGPVAAGMEGGLRNPLGARALYLYRNGRDTHFRLHGTIEPYTIGQSVSSGCIRLINQDIIDLYDRVPAGTKVIVVS